jgi:hypothetical protein
MNSSQKFLMFIAAFFMKVCAGDLVLNVDTVDLGEITPPTTYSAPTNTPILRDNGEDGEIASIFIGAEVRNSASFKALLEELSSSRANNGGILSAQAAESASQKIANRVPTPYYKREETTVISLGAAAKPQADTVSGWPWWYRWLSSFIS